MIVSLLNFILMVSDFNNNNYVDFDFNKKRSKNSKILCSRIINSIIFSYSKKFENGILGQDNRSGEGVEITKCKVESDRDIDKDDESWNGTYSLKYLRVDWFFHCHMFMDDRVSNIRQQLRKSFHIILYRSKSF